MGVEPTAKVQPPTLDMSVPGKRVGLIRRKGYIGPIGLAALTIIGVAPLVTIFSRILSMPWGEALPFSSVGPLRHIGELLNQNLTLNWMPPGDRSAILYLLLLPTGALLVALTRLTFGVRVLGWRAILIAIGFRAAGVGPSLALMLVVVGAIVLIRPWIRRIRLPLYARLSVIMTVSAMIMIGALLLAPWLGSSAVWGVAFFPVIIMAMMAEGVARTVEQDHAVMAAWRASWTIGLALVISELHGQVVRFAFEFPELIFTQLVGIVFISEFLDLRLLEEWPDRISRFLSGAHPWYAKRPKVAVVRNREPHGVIGPLGRPSPTIHLRPSVQRPVDALREEGFEVRVFEGDIKLLGELRKFASPDVRRGTPGGIVLNLATGIQGDGRYLHVPAMLEMAGIPYTGPDPTAHALLSDRFTMMTLLKEADVPHPEFSQVTEVDEIQEAYLPAAVRPRFEPDAGRSVVRSTDALRETVLRIQRAYDQPAVVEKIVRGREIRVSILGNQTLECLPLLDYASGEGNKTCPALLDEAQAEAVRAAAMKAFRAMGCRDYARIDLRLPEQGDPTVIDVKWADLFARRGSFMTSAEAAGYSYAAVFRRIVTEAATRYKAAAIAQAGESASTEVVSLAERRVAAV